MIVVGGTYLERCRDPDVWKLLGSGLRAAAALARTSPDIALVSAIETDGRAIADATAHGFGLRDVAWHDRDQAIVFDYDTPLSPPAFTRLREPSKPRISVSGDAVLMFGMLEMRVDVTADRLIVDPQHDITLSDLQRQRAEHLAVVANMAELRSLSGIGSDAVSMARRLMELVGAEVVVVKRGAMGATVVTADSHDEIGAIPSRRTWPIGSGDAFTAGFALAWGELQRDSLESAAIASRAAAAWCSTRTLPLSAAIFDGPIPPAPKRRPRVYLAAPFFDAGQRWLVDLVHRALEELGASVFSPLHDVGLGAPDAAQQDIEALAGVDAVLALLDGCDPGTLFEVGWGTHAHLPVVVFIERSKPQALTMIAGSGADIYDDLASAVFAAVWAGMG